MSLWVLHSGKLLQLSGDRWMKSGNMQEKKHYSGRFAYNSRHPSKFVYGVSKL